MRLVFIHNGKKERLRGPRTAESIILLKKGAAYQLHGIRYLPNDYSAAHFMCLLKETSKAEMGIMWMGCGNYKVILNLLFKIYYLTVMDCLIHAFRSTLVTCNVVIVQL